jgi:hypothetical protein
MQGRQTILGLVFHRGNRWCHRSRHRLSVRAFSERIRCIRLFPKHCGRFRLFVAWFIRLNDGGEGRILLMHDFGMNLFFNGIKDVLRLHMLLIREEFVRGFEGCHRVRLRSVSYNNSLVLDHTHVSGQNLRNFGYLEFPLPLPGTKVFALAGKVVEAVRAQPEAQLDADRPCRKCARVGGLSVRGKVRTVAGD